MDLSGFKTDPGKTEDGTWVEVGDGRLLIARYGNRKFQRYLQTLMAPYKRLIETGQLKDEIAEEQLIKAIAKHVLLGWENVKIDGENINYSEQTVIDLMSNPQYKDFREYIVQLSQDAEIFRQQEVESTAEK